MATKNQVFNDALALLGQPALDDAEDVGEDGDTLRANWDSVVEYCHEKTGWNFAKVRAELARSVTVPVHGYSYYYTLPAACLRVLYISQSGVPNDPLLDYEEDTGKIATDAETVYITYVSTASLTQLGNWSQAFAYYVACVLAQRCAPKINSSALDPIMREVKKAASDAIGLDATQGPPKRRSHGSWSRAARGSSSSDEQGV